MQISDNRKFRIVLLGMGTVGGAVLRLFKTRSQSAWNFELVAVMSRNARQCLREQAPDGVGLDEWQIFDSWQALHAVLETEKNDVDAAKRRLGTIDAVVELMGGVDTCLPIYDYFLGRGIPVVTANKALLAECGARLFPLAQQHQTYIACEASCGGGIPIIDALLHGLRANCIHEFHGILNGTCNFILSQMASEGRAYGEALAEAQRDGLAEADPHLDVSGKDMAHKLVILAMLAFGRNLKLEDIPTKGIEDVTPVHIRAGEKLGFSLKLLASAWCFEEGRVALRVGPCFVARPSAPVSEFSPSPLANVEGCFNGIVFYGDAVGRMYLEGRGAGASATASAVLADLCQLQNGSYAANFADFPDWPGSGAKSIENGWGQLSQSWLVFVSQNAAAWERMAKQRSVDTQVILEQEGMKIFFVRSRTAKQLDSLCEEFSQTAIPIFEPPQERLCGQF